MLSVRRIPPPPPKKNNLPTTRKNRSSYLGKNVISFRITRSLLIHPYTLSKQSQPSKRNFNPSQKTSTPLPPNIYTPLEQSQPLEKNLDLFLKIQTLPKKILPPPTKKMSINQKISNPSQNISTSPKCFLFILARIRFRVGMFG